MTATASARATPTAQTGRVTPYAALAGVAAAIAGAGVGHLVAGFVAPEGSPVLAVGSTVIDLTPTPVKEWAVATMGTADKVVLVSIVTLVTLALAAGIGVLTRRNRSAGYVAMVVLVGLATLAAMLRPAATPNSALPGLSTALVGVAALTLLMRWVEPNPAPLTPRAGGHTGATPTTLGAQAHPSTRGVQRRAVFLGAGALTLLGGVAGAIGQQLVGVSTQLTRALPTPRKSLLPLPTGLESTIPDITALQTPTANFYRVDTALVIPRIDAGNWSLTIDGDVDNPFTLTYDELLALPMVQSDITLTCVSNEVGGQYAGAARWLGVEVAPLLERAGVRSGVDQILSTSDDGFTCSTPLTALTDDRGSLIAVGMNGELLPSTHGFPARLVTPGLYGYVGATKWLTKLTATTYAAQQAYWTRRQWATHGPIKTMARIDTPRALATSAAGNGVIAGVAWAQGRGIERVEVQIDGGAWTTARLGPDVGIDYWRQWYLPWEATTGRHTIAARAVDGTDAVQTATTATPFPDGASGYHTIVTVVT